MKEIPLLHHIYSSIGGYKTLYSSKGIPDNIVAALDRFSKETYDKIPPACPREVFFTEGGFICLSSKFVNGSDHVGRTRSCVHNVLINRRDVADIPFFNSFFLPDSIFLPHDADLQNTAKYIRRSYLVETGEFVDHIERLKNYNLPIALVKDLIRALASGSSGCIVRGASRKIIEVIEQLSSILPPALRRRISLIAHWPVKQYLVSLNDSFSIAVLSRKESVDAFVKDKFVVIDMAEKRNYNLPPKNAFVDFMAGSVYEDGKLPHAVNLLKVLEHYRMDTVLSPDRYNSFFRAWTPTAGCFTPVGRVDITPDPLACLSSVQDYYSAGYWNIALDIIEKSLELVIKKKQYFRSFKPERAGQIGILAGLLADALKERPAGRADAKPFADKVPEGPLGGKDPESRPKAGLGNTKTRAAMELLQKQNKLQVSEDVADFDA